MKGHIAAKERKGGRRWHPVTEQRDEAGNRRRKWHEGHDTKKAAQRALTAILAAQDAGSYVEPSKLTLGAFLTDQWLPAAAATVRPSTLLSYRLHVRQHIGPRLGRVPLQRLTGGQLNAFYAALLIEGASRRPGGLAPATVRRIHAVLHRALKDAVRWGLLVRNPADTADPPKQSRPGGGMHTWSAAELRTFLQHAEGERLYPALLVAATTGMRRGEVLGLRWEDVDLEDARAAIRQVVTSVNYELGFGEPKTAKGRRVVDLDATTVAGLRSQRARQAEERLAWGPGYRDLGLVFAREDGSPTHPDALGDVFARITASAGLPRIRLHDLRHTHASLALAGGVHPKVVSERLGHAAVSFTLDTYSHTVPSLQREAADRVAALVFGQP